MKPSRLSGRGNPLGRQQEAQVRPDGQEQEEYEESVTIAVPPLTGRDTEFGLLRDRWEQAQEGMGQVVLVVGQPGLGKSRLVQTLTQRVQADPSEEPVAAAEEFAGRYVDQSSSVIEWRCSQRFQNSDLHPVSEFLGRFLGKGRDPSAAACFDRLARHLEDYDLSRPEVVALFAKLLFAPGRSVFDGWLQSGPRAGGDLSRSPRMVASLFCSTHGSIRGRRPALDRRFDPGVSRAFHHRRSP